MWRFWRFSVQGSSHHESSSHLRLLGLSTSNTDYEEKSEDDVKKVFNKEGEPKILNTLVSGAIRKYSNYASFAFGKNFYNQRDTDLWTNSSLVSISRASKEFAIEDVTLKKEVSCNGKTVDPIIGLQNLSVKDPVDINGDSDTFGSLSNQKRVFENLPEDKEDQQSAKKDIYGRRLDSHSYGRKILALCRERKLKEGLDVLEVEMKTQGVTPDVYCFNILINACGKAGYTEKAFNLFYEMKRRGLKVEKFALTGLFNACANSHQDPSERLAMVKQLRKSLKDTNTLLHPITYHAMIKAHGRCGDTEGAFDVADEMLERKHVITTETLNFLLQACISNKEEGFRLALVVWRRMRRLSLKPNIYSYNLLLRCLKECGAGDPRLLHGLLKDLELEANLKMGKKMKKYKRLFSKKLPLEREVHGQILELTSGISNTLDEKIEADFGNFKETNSFTQSSSSHCTSGNAQFFDYDKEFVNQTPSENLSKPFATHQKPQSSSATSKNTQNLYPDHSIDSTTSLQEDEICFSGNKHIERKTETFEQNIRDNTEAHSESVDIQMDEPHGGTQESESLNPSRSGQSLHDNAEVLSKSAGDSVNKRQSSSMENNLDNTLEKSPIPDILGCDMHFDSSNIYVQSLEKRPDRLALLGGFNGVLSSMEADGVQPTPATFTVLLESAPDSTEVENALLKSMERCGVTPDVIFCNMLIRRRCLSRSLEEAKEALNVMQQHHIQPDLITFGCLSIGCKKPWQVKSLLRDMSHLGVTPNEEIFGTLLRNTLRNFEYLCAIELLQRMRSLDIRPSEDVLGALENCRKFIRKQLVREMSELTPWQTRKREEMQMFLLEYTKWLKGSSLSRKEHPWAQYGYSSRGQGKQRTTEGL